MDGPPTPKLYPDHCDQHGNDPVPPPCGRCADQRKANASRPRTPLSLVPPVPSSTSPWRNPWCGHCDERTRQVEVGDEALPMHCPRCHNLKDVI